MTFTGRFARDLILAVTGAALLMAALNGLSKRDHQLAGTTIPSSQEVPLVVTDHCGAAPAGDCRAAFLFHVRTR